MPRNGVVLMDGLSVQRVLHSAQSSELVLTKGQYTVTITRSGKFPDDMHVKPGDTVDIKLDYDPK